MLIDYMLVGFSLVYGLGLIIFLTSIVSPELN